jgi:SsrA-binding protein
MGKKKSKAPSNSIAVNRVARHDYFIEDDIEVGMVLEGWEVKSLRAGNLQLKESYVFVKDGEIWLIGAHISPLNTASTHVKPNPTRTRKLLAHRREIDRLVGMVERKGYTLVALSASRQAQARYRQGQESARQASHPEGPRLETRPGANAQTLLTANTGIREL